MGRFDDRATRPSRGARDILRWRLDRLAGRVPADPEPDYRPPVVPNDGALVHSLESSLTWVGHATFLATIGGVRVAIDPLWSKRISGVVGRRAPPGVPLEALPAADVVLVTHNHRDHLDAPTLRRLASKAVAVAPLGHARLLRSLGFRRVVELDWWQTCEQGALAITLVPARHWSMRHPWDRNAMLWGGFVLRGPEAALYHSGDTAFFDGFSEIGRRTGPLDLALLPIGSYEPRWFMQPQHLDPEEAVEAYLALGARAFVPMHWGTFRLTDEPLGEPPRRLLAAWKSRDLSEDRLWMLGIGETRSLAGLRSTG
jgi:L-ascorbate metabolism protein UlaG (beta-lactamase superfamily)